jgi:hypothetical protein
MQAASRGHKKYDGKDFRNVGHGEVQHEKRKRLKRAGGQADESPSVLTADVISPRRF